MTNVYDGEMEILNTLFDATIILEDPDNNSMSVNVSKYYLSKRSRFFGSVFRKNVGMDIITISIQKSRMFIMKVFLQFLHVTTNALASSQYLFRKYNCEHTFYELALQFDVPDIFNLCKLSIEELSCLYNFIEQQDGYIGVDIFRWKPKIWEAEQIFLQKAGEILRDRFQNINDILEHKEEFVSLPIQAVMEILKNPSIRERDPEFSILGIVMTWVKMDLHQSESDRIPAIREREIYLKQLIPFMNLSSLSLQKVISEIANPEIRYFVIEAYATALQKEVQSKMFFPKNTNDILHNQHVFNRLPIESVKEILRTLKSPFCSKEKDFEETYFIIVMMWINNNHHDFREREIYLKELLYLVDFTRLSRYFLLNIVSNVIEDIINPEMQQFAAELYVKTLETTLGSYNGEFEPELKTRLEFIGISKWYGNDDYSSQPLYYKGYTFFLQISKKKSWSDDLVIHLGCTCFITKQTRHYLPVEVTLSIDSNDGKTLQFPTVSGIFEHYDQLLRLDQFTSDQANFEKIKSGQSDIVKDDKIAVILRLVFPQ